MVTHLPYPPTDEEKGWYRNTYRLFLYLPGLFGSGMLLIGMWLFVFAHPNLIFYIGFLVINSVYLGLSYFVGIFGRDFNFSGHPSRRALYESRRLRQTVDVYLPCCGEDIEILQNTYKHVRALDWPEGQLHVYVLDDRKDPRVKLLADKFEFNYIARPNSGEMKKAGNMRYAFARTHGQFIAVFDADFCPRPDFLKELMPYMTEKVAIVQSPQYFSILENQTWVEKGAGYIQEFFYRLVQVSRNHWWGAICVGSNAIYRREALAPHGGTYPIAYSEDVHTGWQVTHDGWRVSYVPLNLAKGNCPSDVKSFFLQQYRWATGSLSLLFNWKFWVSRLTVMQKLCYFSGQLYYLSTGLSVILNPLPSLVLVWFYPKLVFWYNMMFTVPSFVFSFVLIPCWTKHKFGWYAPRCRMVANHAHLFALVDKLRGSMIPWQASGAVGKVNRFEDLRNLIFYWTSISTLLIFMGAGSNLSELPNFLPTLFFVSFNAWLNLTILRDQ